MGEDVSEAGSVSFFVHGRPAPKGSYRRGRHGAIIPASKYLAEWSEAVEARAKIHAGDSPISGPVMLQADFLLARPKGHFHTSGQLAARAIGSYPRRPDLDKLLRATMDALVSAGLLADDSQILEIHASKRYAISTSSGVSIGIWSVLP